MIYLSGKQIDYKLFAFIGIMSAYILTCVLLKYTAGKLPKDGGRDFAHDGKLSAGKPRGAGFIFILIFSIAVLIFTPFSTELFVYLILTIAAMITGFLDDCSKSPWGEYKKGLLDLIISVMTAIAYVNFNSSTINLNFNGLILDIPPVLFVILATILIWASINVTNCSDGVDGLCGTLSIVTLMSIYTLSYLKGLDGHFNYTLLIMVSCILGYLWYNATPSKMIMGDAGSRALGLFISIAALKTGNALLFIPFAFCTKFS
jgi:phospho-N-acetylmuramoyl-pentapeptide-transferase